MPDIYNAIVRPVITEKSSAAYAARREYAFVVKAESTKRDIAESIAALFGVRVKQVRTLMQRSKRKTMGKYVGRRPKWKKAYVTLEGDDSIEVFEG